LCLEEYALSEALSELPPPLIVIADEEGLPPVHEEAPSPWSGGSEGDLAEEIALAPMEFERPAPAFDFAPGSAATGRGTAVRTAGRARRQKGSPLRSVLSMVLGGLLAFPVAQLILWYLPGDLKRDFGLGPVIAQYFPQIVPAKFHGQRTIASPAKAGAPQPDASRSLIPDFHAAEETEQQNEDHSRQNSNDAPANTETASERSGEPDTQGDVSTAVDAADVKIPDIQVGPLAISSSPTRSVASPASDTTEHEPQPAVGTWRDAPRLKSEDFLSSFLGAVDTNSAWDTSGRSASTATRETRQNFYQSLTKLGEVLAAVEGQQPISNEHRANLETLLKAISQQPEKLSLIAQVGAGWLKIKRPNDGIVLTGVIDAIEPRGELLATRLRLATQEPETVSVVRVADPSEHLQPGQRLLVLGAVVAQPTENLAGFRGNEATVVLDAFHLVLDQQ